MPARYPAPVRHARAPALALGGLAACLWPALGLLDSCEGSPTHGADLAPAAPAGDPLASTEQCVLCHSDVAATAQGSPHAGTGVGCAGCHGESRGHREAENNAVKPDLHFSGPSGAESILSLCSRCHGAAAEAARAGVHHGARRPEPGTPAPCAACHDPHE